MSEFKHEERYIVVKLKRIDYETKQALRDFLDSRRVPTEECVVVEHDWPIYEPVWDMVQALAEGNQSLLPEASLGCFDHPAMHEVFHLPVGGENFSINGNCKKSIFDDGVRPGDAVAYAINHHDSMRTANFNMARMLNEQAAELERLKQFADEMIAIAFQGGDADGAHIQETATRTGLLKETTQQEPCGENCACAEYGEFPATCYRKTYGV
jgi:hypothetical protein